MIITRCIEKIMPQFPDVRFAPIGRIKRGENRRVAQAERQSLPALRQEAVFWMKTIIIPVIKGVATGQMGELI